MFVLLIFILIIYILITHIWSSTKPQQSPKFQIVNAMFKQDFNVCYINLNTRQDRKLQIEEELNHMGWSYSRIPGVWHSYGALGCSRAHYNALNYTIAENQHTAIFEDDALFATSKINMETQIAKLDNLHIEWDVILFLANVHEFEESMVDGLLQIHAARTTAGYMVHRNYLPMFKRNVKTGIEELEITLREPCIDTNWLDLQQCGKWFTFYPVVAYQRDGYSDIEKRITNYPDKRDLKPNLTRDPILKLSFLVKHSSLIFIEFGNSVSFDIRRVAPKLQIRNLGDLFHFLYLYTCYHDWITGIKIGDSNNLLEKNDFEICDSSIFLKVPLLSKILSQDREIYQMKNSNNFINVVTECLRGWQILPVFFHFSKW